MFTCVLLYCLELMLSVGYLFKKPGYRDEMDRLQKLMDHLKEQERGYTGLLQTLLVSEQSEVFSFN